MGVMLLGKIKIYDLAKELDLTSKEVIEIAQKLKIDAKSHLSSIEDDEAKRIKESAKNKNNENSKRLEIKQLIEKLEKESKFIPFNIFRATENVNLDMMRCYKTKGKKYNFLDNYDKKEDE